MRRLLRTLCLSRVKIPLDDCLRWRHSTPWLNNSDAAANNLLLKCLRATVRGKCNFARSSMAIQPILLMHISSCVICLTILFWKVCTSARKAVGIACCLASELNIACSAQGKQWKRTIHHCGRCPQAENLNERQHSHMCISAETWHSFLMLLGTSEVSMTAKNRAGGKLKLFWESWNGNRWPGRSILQLSASVPWLTLCAINVSHFPKVRSLSWTKKIFTVYIWIYCYTFIRRHIWML